MEGRKLIILLILLVWSGQLALGQGAADCRDFVVICGSTSLSLNSSGVGAADFGTPGNPVPPCWGPFPPEHQSLWLKVPVAEDGVLEFTIAPNNPGDDFDFAVFGPNVTCNTLGAPLRCSTSAPPSSVSFAPTGLSASANDVSEGPGTGDGFLSVLEVKQGEEYFIFIDNFSATNGGFELQWGNSTPLFTPPAANSLGDQEYCDPDGDGSLTVDLTELNDEVAMGLAEVEVKYYLAERDALTDQNQLNARNYVLDVNERQIFATVTSNATGCFALTSFNVVLRSLDPLNPVTGTQSVCPTVEGVAYSTTPTNADSYEWIVEGGEIASGQGTTEITVDWGVANDAAAVKLIAKSNTGCVSDTLVYPVKVNERLEPESPQGPDVVCFNDRPSVRYSVPQVPGSEYDWDVVNGEIIGDNDRNEVEIRWDNDATDGRVFFKEFNLSIAQCEGFSDTLNVQLLPEINVSESVTESLCAGDNSGEITLALSGGVGDLAVQWVDGATGAVRSNLAPGVYEYVVTDDLSCQKSGSISITEPDNLSIDGLTMISASCYELKDGGLMATVAGGTGGYRYEIDGKRGNLNGNALEIKGLGRGTHDLRIFDDNDCVLEQQVTVSAPELLRVNMESLMIKPACPGMADGGIDLDALGGTPVYRFFWTPNEGQQDQGSIEGIPSGDYTVRVEDMNGCSDDLTITVDETLPRVQVPTAFSPNDDDQNERFAPVSNCRLDAYRFQVYNRWGNVVFATEDQANGWNGTVNDQPAPLGKYSYKLSYRLLVNGQLIEENYQGTFRLFR